MNLSNGKVDLSSIVDLLKVNNPKIANGSMNPVDYFVDDVMAIFGYDRKRNKGEAERVECETGDSYNNLLKIHMKNGDLLVTFLDSEPGQGKLESCSENVFATSDFDKTLGWVNISCNSLAVSKMMENTKTVVTDNTVDELPNPGYTCVTIEIALNDGENNTESDADGMHNIGSLLGILNNYAYDLDATVGDIEGVFNDICITQQMVQIRKDVYAMLDNNMVIPDDFDTFLRYFLGYAGENWVPDDMCIEMSQEDFLGGMAARLNVSVKQAEFEDTSSKKIEAMKAENDAEIQRIKAEHEEALKGKDDQINALISEKESAIEELNRSHAEEISEKDAQISEIEAKKEEEIQKINEQHTCDINEKDASIEKLMNEIVELKDEVEKLGGLTEEMSESERDTLNSRIAELEQRVAELLDTYQNEKNRADAAEKKLEEHQVGSDEDAGSGDEVAELKGQLDELRTEKESLAAEKNAEIEQLRARITELEENQADADNSSDESEKDSEIGQLKERIAELEESQADAGNRDEILSQKEAEIASLKEQIESLGQQIITIKDVKIEHAEIAQSSEGSESKPEQAQSVDKDIINEYKERIKSLTGEIEQYKEQNLNLTKEVSELKDMYEKSDESYATKFNRMLSVFKSDDDAPRTYILGINSEISQHNTPIKLVGEALSKLYELKSTSASPYLFDGDIFKLQSGIKDGTVTIGNRKYGINLRGLTEDDVIRKLTILFSKFDDLYFNCVKLGKEPEYIEELAEKSEESDEDVEGEGTDETQDDGDYDLSDESSEDLPLSHIVTSINKADIQGLYSVYSDLGYPILIGDDIRTFKVDSNNEEDFSDSLAKSIEILIALESKRGNDLYAPIKLNKGSASEAVEHIGNKYARLGGDEGFRVFNTKIMISGVHSFKEYLKALFGFVGFTGIDSASYFLYFDVPDGIEELGGYYISDEEIPQVEHFDTFSGEEGEYKNAIIAGSIMAKVPISRQTIIDIASQVVVGDFEVSNNNLRGVISSMEDFCDISKQFLLLLASNSDELEVDKLCTVEREGRGYPVFSCNPDFTYTDKHTIDGAELGVDDIYVTELTPFEQIITLIKMHVYGYKNYSIAFRTKVDATRVDELDTFEMDTPYEQISVNALAKFFRESMDSAKK